MPYLEFHISQSELFEQASDEELMAELKWQTR